MINVIASVYIHCDSLFMIAVLDSRIKVSTRIKICGVFFGGKGKGGNTPYARIQGEL